MLFPAVLVGLLLSQAPAPAPATATAAGADLIESAKNGDLARTRDLLSEGRGGQHGRSPRLHAADVGGRERQPGDGPAAARKRRGRRAARGGRDDGPDAGVGQRLHRRSSARCSFAARTSTAARGGIKARQLAIDRGHADVAALLEQAEALGTPHAAGRRGRQRHARAAAARPGRAGQRQRDERGATALMIAARNGDLGMMQALLSRGADAIARPTTRDKPSSGGPSRRRRPASTSWPFSTDQGISETASPRDRTARRLR